MITISTSPYCVVGVDGDVFVQLEKFSVGNGNRVKANLGNLEMSDFVQ